LVRKITLILILDINMKTSKKIALALVTTGVSGASMAADLTTQITAASTEGTGNVTAVIAAVIAIAILGFGVNAVLGWFRK
jgi:hypothetical protein